MSPLIMSNLTLLLYKITQISSLTVGALILKELESSTILDKVESTKKKKKDMFHVLDQCNGGNRYKEMTTKEKEKKK